jgi:hypothetical protein
MPAATPFMPLFGRIGRFFIPMRPAVAPASYFGLTLLLFCRKIEMTALLRRVARIP